jgi:hypothetical protein
LLYLTYNIYLVSAKNKSNPKQSWLFPPFMQNVFIFNINRV